MKAEEAKGMMQGKLTCMELETLSWKGQGCGHDCDNCEYNYAQGTFGEHKEAIAMAIEALEKQIPKKPYIQQDERNNDCLECPNCDSFIGFAVDCKDEHYQIPHCPNCGQAIDWSEEE